MRRVNKVVLIFFIFTIAVFYSVLEVLQSDFLGNNASKAINKALVSKYGVSVNFQKVKFQLFPPGIELRNVRVDDTKNNEFLFLTSKIGAYFDIRDIFLEKPTISEILIFDGHLKLNIKKSKEKESESTGETRLETVKVTEYIKLLEDKLPIDFKKINFNQSSLDINNSTIDLRKLLIRKRKDNVKVKLTSYNLDLTSIHEKIPKLDTITLDLVIDDNEIDIKSSTIQKDVNTLELSGEFENNLTKVTGKGSLRLQGELSEIKKYVDLSKIGDLTYGIIDAKAVFDVKDNKPQFSTELSVNDFKTDFCYGDKLVLAVSADLEQVIFKKFNLQANKQRINLLQPFEFFNFKSKKFVEEDVIVEVNQLKLDNALSYLKDSLSILKGKLTGKLRFTLLEKSFHFFIKEEMQVNDLYLGEKEKPILSIENGILKDTEFSVVEGVFKMNASVELPNSNIVAQGEIKKGDVNFSVKNANIDFKDFGKFAGFTLLGSGMLDLNVYKNKEDHTLIELVPELEGFSFENYQLGSTKGKIYFNLSESEIAVKDLVAKQGKANLTGGAVLNYGNGDVSASAQVDTKRYVDIKKILNPLLSPLDFIPEDVFGDWLLKANVSGKMDLDNLVVDVNFLGKNNYVYDESFERIGFDLSLVNQVLNLKNIKASKSNGSLLGEYSFNLKTQKMLYDLRFANIPIRDINWIDRSPLELDAEINGTLKGENFNKSNTINAEIVLDKTYVSTRRVKDSKFIFNMSDKTYKFDASLFGDEISFEGKLYDDKEKTSEMALKLDTNDIPLYLSILKFVDKSTLNMTGEVKLNSSLNFPGTDYTNSNFKLMLEKFVFKKESVDIDYKYNRELPQFIIDNGLVKNWDLEIEGRKFYLISKGSGNLTGQYTINNDFKVDASILETLNKIISKANGTLRGKVKFFDKSNRPDYEATLISNNLSISTSYLPTEIKDTKLQLEYKKNKILVKRIRAGLSAGYVDISGDVNIGNIIPELNLKMLVNEAGIPILGKSSLVVSADTNLVGKKPPYTLSGDVVINKLLIVNDIQDFTSGESAILKKEYEYLPQQNKEVFSNYLALNLNIDTKEPMYLSNSFADVGMIGDLQLLGGENDPKLVGSLSLAPRTNKITFKNIDYLLNKGNVYFYSQNKISNPEIDFIAESAINDYKVNVKVYGPVSDFKLDLTSTPALAQEDILSLIAFGYTKDLSANLSDAERESMTQAGVGSILFDSFKINETLKSEFGLQVNLGTQIQQDETSLLNQRNSDGTRVRSATTIEVKKKLNDAMNLSVSSTVGGSAGQKQSMNLNYNINNKVSVEGVYETRTAPEGEEAIINDTSFGADVKVRWSFK